jgi:uncharacterized membrane protein
MSFDADWVPGWFGGCPNCWLLHFGLVLARIAFLVEFWISFRAKCVSGWFGHSRPHWLLHFGLVFARIALLIGISDEFWCGLGSWLVWTLS